MTNNCFSIVFVFFCDIIITQYNFLKKGYLIMKKFISVVSLLLAALFVLTACTTDPGSTSSAPQPGNVTVTCQQVEGTQQVDIKWTSDAELTKVDVTVLHGDLTVSTVSIEGDALSAKEIKADAFYGKQQIKVDFTFANGTATSKTSDVSLSADEYVIAPVSGSMPQLYFTLYMNEITDNHSIPAFVWLARPDSWNWDNLPENVFPMPTVEKSEVLTHNNYDRMVEVTDKYIEELFAINPDAKFNLYINDYNSYLYLKLLTANGIPEENYTVTLLSDGGASYNEFNAAFNSEDTEFDADAKYADMASKLSTLYTEVAEAKDYSADGSFTVDTSEFRQYSYVAAKEKTNIEWWILRPRSGVLCSPDTEFIDNVLNNEVSKAPYDAENSIIEERNFAAPLTSLTEEEEKALKALYNFSNEMFEAADEQDKKAMMILGSWANAENEPEFESYVKFVKAFYGDEFVYYYKGHPNTPTSTSPYKQEQLKELDLIDVESSINAELILFFYPDIYMCGYASSTFLSVESSEMACALFNMTKEEGNSSTATEQYCDLIGLYVSKITDIGKYDECTEKDHVYLLAEDNHGDGYIIFDGTADEIVFDSINN